MIVNTIFKSVPCLRRVNGNASSHLTVPRAAPVFNRSFAEQTEAKEQKGETKDMAVTQARKEFSRRPRRQRGINPFFDDTFVDPFFGPTSSLLPSFHRSIFDLDRWIDRWRTTEMAPMDRLADWSPQADTSETNDSFIIHAELAGVPKENVKVEVEGSQLVIKGKKESEINEEDSDKNIVKRERLYGTFMRRFPIPENANMKDLKAKYNNGVLEVTIPKLEKGESHSVPVE